MLVDTAFAGVPLWPGFEELREGWEVGIGRVGARQMSILDCYSHYENKYLPRLEFDWRHW